MRNAPTTTALSRSAALVLGALAFCGCQKKDAETPNQVVMVSGVWQAHLGADDQPELFSQLSTQGFRLMDVSGYSLKGEPRYASVWLFGDGRGWQELHGVDADTLTKTNEAYVKAGLALSHVSGFDTSKGPRFAAIWEPDGAGTKLDLRLGLTGPEMIALEKEHEKQPVRLIDVSGWVEQDVAHFTGVWAPQPEGLPKTTLSIDLDASALDALIADASAKGARIVRLGGYEVEGQPRFYALLVESPGPYWMARRDLTPADYQAMVEDMVQVGYRLAHLSAYTVKGEARYAVVWTR